MTRRLLLLLLAALWVRFPAAAGEFLVYRDGLPNWTAQLLSGEPARLALLGGGLMQGAGAGRPEDSLAQRIHDAWAEAFPGALIRTVRAGEEGVGSWLGAFLAPAGLSRSAAAPGLIVMEFASEDAEEEPERIRAAVEGMVRRFRSHPASSDSDLAFVYALGPGDLEAYLAGGAPGRLAVYEAIADHYGIPSVHAGAAAARAIRAGRLASEAVAGRERAPSDAAHAAYAGAFRALVERAAAADADSAPRPMPGPLFARRLEWAEQVSYEASEGGEGWLDWQRSPVERFGHVTRGDRPGAGRTLRVRAETVGLRDVDGPDAADLEVSVNGGPWRRVKAARPPVHRARAVPLAEGLDPGREHLVRVRLPEEDLEGRSARIAFFLVNGETIRSDPHEGMDAGERMDALWAAMDPLAYTPPPDRWRHLPRTRRTLLEGPGLTLVMLGDSIVNDTARSGFERLLMRHYPDCPVRKVVSVRGSTGCGWYREEGRVEEYVTRHGPDLLMIGGISHGNDTESIREVIRQARAAQPALEILLMTGPFGRVDPQREEEWVEETPREGDTYEARLRRLAEEERAAFLDLRGAWGRYLRDSSHATGSFLRDAIHANSRGEQLLGRILERFFAPDDPGG